ncbi:MAG: hypothetical protein LBS59_04180 [Puniceicoccales bacterium]|jgi:biopolymer transport protein ExbD|nr:hypothetical protein [Puniceicoccales bacterium]
MRLVPVLSLCVLASLLLSGCGESPFALAPRPNPDSVIVEIRDDDKVFVNYKPVPSARLVEVLNDFGKKYSGRPVTLVVHEKTHPNAIPYAKEAAKGAGLGKVTVMQRNPKGLYRARPAKKQEDAAPVPAPEEKPAAPVAPVPAPAAPAPEPAPVAPAPAPVAPAPAPAPTPVAPAAPAPISIHATHGTGAAPSPENTLFIVNGKTVARADLHAALRELGTATPGRNVEFSRDAQVGTQTLLFIHEAVRAAGLGTLSSKAK